MLQKSCSVPYSGSSAATQAECPPPKDPSPYCNTPAAENLKSCWDVKDNSDDTGMYSCNDGTHKTDWRDCEDVSDEYKAFCKTNPLLYECHEVGHKYIEKIKSCDDLPFYMTCHGPDEKKNDNDNDKKVIQKTTVIQSATATANANANANTNAADVSNCKLNGSADGIQQKFNPVKYQACGLYTSADKAYYDGFVAGCMQVGNTKLICETVANSNIIAPPAQMQTATQPIQAIQPAAVS